MKNNLFYVSDPEYTVPTAAPVVLPYDVNSTRRTNYWEYSRNYDNLHLLVRADSAWNDPMVASVLTLYGYPEDMDGNALPPKKIFSISISEPLPVDVEITANTMGYKWLYLQNVSGTAVAASIVCEGKHTSNQPAVVY